MSRPKTPLLELRRQRKRTQEKIARFEAALARQKEKLANTLDIIAAEPARQKRPDATPETLLNEERRALVLYNAKHSPETMGVYDCVKVKHYMRCLAPKCPNDWESEATTPAHFYRLVYSNDDDEVGICYNCFMANRQPEDIVSVVASYKEDYVHRKQDKPYMAGVDL